MPVNLSFNKISEKKPEHGQIVIWLQEISSFGHQGFELREIEVEYQWTEFDEDGDTGNSSGYRITDKPEDGWRLDIIFDSWIVEDNFLWCSEDEYWNSFKK